MIKVRFFFAWYDFWIGAYYDRYFKILYVCPLPMCVIAISGPAADWSHDHDT